MNESKPPPTTEDSRCQKGMWSRRRFLKIGLVGGGVGLLWVRLGGYAGYVEGLRHLSARRGRILADIVEAMLPSSAPQTSQDITRYVRAIDETLTGMEQADINQLGLLLDAMEHTTWMFGPALRRLTRLPKAARRQVLRGWQMSRWAMARLGLQSLKTLVFLAYYRTPEAYRSIGYEGPTIPIGFRGPLQSQQRYDRLLAPSGATPHFANPK